MYTDDVVCLTVGLDVDEAAIGRLLRLYAAGVGVAELIVTGKTEVVHVLGDAVEGLADTEVVIAMSSTRSAVITSESCSGDARERP